MNPQEPEETERLLCDALDLPPARRGEFLDAACGARSPLRLEVESLLSAYERGGRQLCDRTTDRRSPSGVVVPSLSPPSERIADTGPRRFGHYTLLEHLGRGGQGAVYVARDRVLNRRVALKMLTVPWILSPATLWRFRREAETASRIDHPGICTVYEAGEVDGVPFIAMQYLEGVTLADRIAAARSRPLETGAARCPRFVILGPPGPRDARQPGCCRRDIQGILRFHEQTARALHAAHEQGLVHRDVKPANIMVTKDGRPVLLDFGLVRDVNEPGPSWSDPGDIMGTPYYMSPEQISPADRRLDRRTDVYSLGVTLYESLTLRLPFEAATREGLFQRILSSVTPDPRRHNPLIARDLVTVLETALERRPDRRYQTAIDLAEDLRRIRECRPIRARPVSRALRLRRWAQRNPVVATCGLGSFLVLIAALVVALLVIEQRTQSVQSIRALALAAASASAMERNPQLALLLAVEAVNCEERKETISQLQASLATTLQIGEFRHDQPVLSAVLSADQRRVLTASLDGSAVLWDLDGERMIQRFEHDDGVVSAIFSPEEDRVLTASADGTAVIWDLSGQDLATLEHGAGITSALFSCDGARILTASDDGTAGLWSVQGEWLASVGHADRVTSALFVPVGEDLIFTTSADGSARLSSPDGSEIWSRKHPEAVTLGVVSADGERLATVSAHTLSIWTLDGVAVATLPAPRGVRYTSATFSPAGDSLLACYTDATARRFTSDGALLNEFRGHRGRLYAGAFSSENDRVLTASSDQSVRVFHPGGDPIAELRGHRTDVLGGSFVGTDRILTWSYDGSARLWRTSSPELPVLISHRRGYHTTDLSADGRLLLGAHDESLRLWDTEDGHLRSELPMPTVLRSAAFSPDGTLLVTAHDDRVVRLWDLQGTLLGEYQGVGDDVYTASVSPDGRLVAAGTNDRDGHAHVWRRDELHLLELRHGSGVKFARFRDDRHLLTASRDRRARLWNLETGKVEVTFEGHRGDVNWAAYNRAGDRLVTASGDTTVRLWSADGQLLNEFHGHEGAVWCATFSPDGQTILSTARDGTARLWDLDGKELRVLRGHQGTVWSGHFMPSGKRVITSASDGTTRFWCLDTRELLGLAGRRLHGDFADERERYAELLGH